MSVRISHIRTACFLTGAALSVVGLTQTAAGCDTTSTRQTPQARTHQAQTVTYTVTSDKATSNALHIRYAPDTSYERAAQNRLHPDGSAYCERLAKAAPTSTPNPTHWYIWYECSVPRSEAPDLSTPVGGQAPANTH